MIFKDGLTPHYLCLIKSTYWKWPSFWVLHFLEGPWYLSLQQYLNLIPLLILKKVVKKQDRKGEEIEQNTWQFYTALDGPLSPSSASKNPTSWYCRNDGNWFTAGLCPVSPGFTPYSLYSYSHCHQRSQTMGLGHCGLLRAVCEPSPPSQADWCLMVEVAIYEHSSSSNLVCDGNARGGSPSCTHLAVLLKSAKDVVSTFGTSLPFLLCWTGLVGPNTLGELTDRNKCTQTWF